MPIVVLDFETTGLSPASCEVVEFALVRVSDEGEIGLNIASLCRPHGEIPYGAYRVHGISMEMVRDKPYFEQFLPTVINFIGQDTVVCHNTPFDMGFLMAYCQRAGRTDFNPRTDDTLRIARRMFPHLPSRSLAPLAQYLGVEFDSNAHRALADALVTAKVYIEMQKRAATGGLPV